MVNSDSGLYFLTIRPVPYLPPNSFARGVGRSAEQREKKKPVKTPFSQNAMNAILFAIQRPLHAQALYRSIKFPKINFDFHALTPGIAAFTAFATVSLLPCKATAIQFMIVIIGWRCETVSKCRAPAWRFDQSTMTITAD